MSNKLRTFILVAIIAALATATVAYSASGDRTGVNKLAHGAPASSSEACVQGSQRVTAKFIFTCMTSGVWKNMSTASF